MRTLVVVVVVFAGRGVVIPQDDLVVSGMETPVVPGVVAVNLGGVPVRG